MTQIPKRLSEHPKVVTKNKTWEVEIIYSQAEGGKKNIIYLRCRLAKKPDVGAAITNYKLHPKNSHF